MWRKESRASPSVPDEREWPRCTWWVRIQPIDFLASCESLPTRPVHFPPVLLEAGFGFHSNMRTIQNASFIRATRVWAQKVAFHQKGKETNKQRKGKRVEVREKERKKGWNFHMYRNKENTKKAEAERDQGTDEALRRKDWPSYSPAVTSEQSC